jgi:hypothetical protein
MNYLQQDILLTACRVLEGTAEDSSASSNSFTVIDTAAHEEESKDEKVKTQIKESENVRQADLST